MNDNFQKGAAKFSMWQPAGGWSAFRANNPEGGSASLRQARWPGGGTGTKTADELFDFLEDCDARNYVVCAGTGAGANFLPLRVPRACGARTELVRRCLSSRLGAEWY
jgi:hypothetical protein